MTALLELLSVSKEFAQTDSTVHVLSSVSLSLKSGETLAVTGPSGSGKSTLLGLMAGLEAPTLGKVLYKGHPLAALDEAGLAAFRRRSVGFIFQNFRLVPTLTALENAMLPLELLGWDVPSARARAGELLHELGLATRADHFPGQLSGGEQQRVAIARAYAHGPELILADEPTGSLDRETGLKVFDSLLREQRASSAALVVVTHDPSVAERMGRTLALEAGRLQR